MAVNYKLKCITCKKNYVVVTRKQRFVNCKECEDKQFNKEITDPAMKKMFNIPEEFYRTNSFLKDIKLNYHRFESLSDRQIAAFKETVKKMKDKAKEKTKEPKEENK